MIIEYPIFVTEAFEAARDLLVPGFFVSLPMPRQLRLLTRAFQKVPLQLKILVRVV
jgi:hypothetical protein